jgi:hypothetical protein
MRSSPVVAVIDRQHDRAARGRVEDAREAVLHAPIELVRALQEEAGRALCLIRVESRTFIVGFRHGSLSYGLARSDGSDRFIELYHVVAIAQAAAARTGKLG